MAQSDDDKSKFKVKLSIMAGLALLIAVNLSLYIPNILIYQSTYVSIIYLIVSVLSFIIVVLYLITDFNLKKIYAIFLVLILILIVVFPFIPQVGNIVEVPNVIDKNQSDAVIILANERLDVNFSYNTSVDSKRGKIIAQYPKNGVYLYKGTKVNLIIGNGTTPLITISSPLPNSNVTSVPTRMNGTINNYNLSSDEHIYVFVQPQPRGSDGFTSDGPYEWYTQPGVVIRNNTWVTNIYLGHEGDDYDIGRNFVVAVVVSKENITTNTVYGFNLPKYESLQTITLTRR
jgi:hypothetical protein